VCVDGECSGLFTFPLLLLIQLLCRVDVFDIVSCALMEILYVYLGHFLNSPINIRTSVVLLAEICN